jgi:hypothetical protein
MTANAGVSQPMSTVPEIVDPVFAKTSRKSSLSMTAYESFGLVFTKTRVYKFGHSCAHRAQINFRDLPPHFNLVTTATSA